MSAIHDRLFSNHDEALALRARRADMLASNLANADTPHYKARDLDFRDALAEAQGGQLNLQRTQSPHLPVGDASLLGAHLSYRVPTQASLDGNTVDAQQEQARFSENAVQYQATLTFLNGNIAGMMSALRGE